MAIGAISNIYLLIFLPLIASLFCQILPKKNWPFLLTLASCITLFLLALRIFPDVLAHEKIANDFELSPLSIALEFRLDLLGMIFLLLLIFLKIVILFFYRGDIEKSLNDENRRTFYSVFLLHLFSLIGIFTTNNLLNLFLFFEIYGFSFFATISIAKDLDLFKLSFRYFCLNAASSLIILFCFFVIYLIFGDLNFDQISKDLPLISQDYSWFLITIFFLLTFAFLIKFFPIWLSFEKIKNNSLLASFAAIDSLFVKTNVGIFLMLKFVYFFFGSKFLFSGFNIDLILIILAISLIIYSAVKLYSQKHLKLICAYSCLNNLGFILAAVALQTVESMQATFFYLLNFSLVNLFIFIFATFLKRHFSSSSINKIALIKNSHFSLILPFKLLILFIAAFPLTILFFANWYIAYASFKLGLEGFLIFALIATNFVYMSLAVRLIESFFSKIAPEEKAEMLTLDFKKYHFYLASFWFLVITIYATFFFSGFLNKFSLRFASYLLSNAI